MGHPKKNKPTPNWRETTRATSFRMPRELLLSLDEAARHLGISRSALVVRALTETLPLMQADSLLADLPDTDEENT